MLGKEGYERPEKLIIDEATSTDTYVRIVAEPWENGYGYTVGNALRRVLLSSMEGVAVTSVKIDGVAHEFSSIPNVVEDVMEIVLNIKKLKFNCVGQLPRTLELYADRAGQVTAASIRDDSVVEVLNKDQVICTLDCDVDTPLRMELEIDRGRGYRPAEENKKPDMAVGTIPVDSLFSPVERVRYNVEACRVGQHTDYDSLEMEIWTDGRILPLEALAKSANILRDLFTVFVAGKGEFSSKNEPMDPIEDLNQEEKDLLSKLELPVSVLELNVRADNCMSTENITYLGELVERTESQMLKCRNFGRKSLDEVADKLREMGLSLEMHIPDAVKDEFQRFLNDKSKNKED